MTMYHVVKGQGATTINGAVLEWQERDCFFVPPLQWHGHENRSSSERAILFTVSDRPALEALGLYREEGR
jgi:gentisate 1,2-dioxygenase